MRGAVNVRISDRFRPWVPGAPDKSLGIVPETLEDVSDTSIGLSRVHELSLEASNPLHGVAPEQYDLILPSSSISTSRKLASTSLREKEEKLRIAQLEGYLQELRRLIRLRACVYSDKKRNSRGQKSCTRSMKMLTDLCDKITLIINYYQHSRAALLRLNPDGSWQNQLKELKKKDESVASKRERCGDGRGPPFCYWQTFPCSASEQTGHQLDLEGHSREGRRRGG